MKRDLSVYSATRESARSNMKVREGPDKGGKLVGGITLGGGVTLG